MENKRLEYFLSECNEEVKNEDWDTLGANMMLFPEFYDFSIFAYYDKLPDKIKRRTCIAMYQHRGDSLPCVRNAIRHLKKNGQNSLKEAEWYHGEDAIDIYRAGEEDINKAKYRISWTASKEKAIWFLNDYICNHATHLYHGKIKVKNIIDYSNSRKEEEIFQYRNVYDIEDITEQLKI